VKLSFGAGTAVRQFIYDDVPPWPTVPDGGGQALTLIAPATVPDHTVPTNWRFSAAALGGPGQAEGQTYAAWATQYASGPAGGDDDGDGLSNWLEYALGGRPNVPPTALLPQATWEDGYFTLSLRRRIDADEVAMTAAVSLDLVTWEEGPPNVERLRQVPHPDGTMTEVWRSALPAATNPRQFLRARLLSR
jgi:hypothetical protein